MEDPYYSHGVRQTLFMLFRNRTDFRLIQTDRRPDIDCMGVACDKQPEEETFLGFRKGFENATFCVVASGVGWSQRAKMALLHGCIPIVFADHVQVGPTSPYLPVLLLLLLPRLRLFLRRKQG